MLISLLLLAASAAASQIALNPDPSVLAERALVIGPFPIGTRESTLFTSDAWRTPITASAPSALGRNGSVNWQGVDVLDGRIEFRFDVDWPTLSDGWGGQQYEAFALLHFDSKDVDLYNYRIRAEGASEIGVQRECVWEPLWNSADYYSRGGLGSPAYLPNGHHCLWIRYIHDIRIRGADAAGSVKLSIAPAQLRIPEDVVAPGKYMINPARVLIGEIVAPDHGYGEYIGVEVINDSVDWICARFEGNLELVSVFFSTS